MGPDDGPKNRIDAFFDHPKDLELVSDVDAMTTRDLGEFLAIERDARRPFDEPTIRQFRRFLREEYAAVVLLRATVPDARQRLETWRGQAWDRCPQPWQFTGRTWQEHPGRIGRPPRRGHPAG